MSISASDFSARIKSSSYIYYRITLSLFQQFVYQKIIDLIV